MKWRTLRGQPIGILARGSRAPSHIGELIVASQHIQSLRTARNSMVEVRRRLALKIGNPSMQPSEYASNFLPAVQSGIEAIDRAIADEESELAKLDGSLPNRWNAPIPGPQPLAS
jgi:hypothetical protein